MSRPFLAPECLQLSSMDCGVAAVFTLLSGHGVHVNYEALRELCQTGVDGTSIDSLEDLCNELGVEVVQHVVPTDLVGSVMEGRLPLLAIVARGRGIPHFVTVWRRVGPYLQIMDPAGGRSWVHRDDFVRDLFPHPFELNHDDWRCWMADNSYREALLRRADEFLPRETVTEIATPVMDRVNPVEVAALDGALRLLARVAKTDGGKSRRWNERLFRRTYEAATRDETLARKLSVIRPDGDDVRTVGTVLLAPPEPSRTGPSRAAPHAAEVARPEAQTAQADRTSRKRERNGSESASLLSHLQRLLGRRTRWFAYALAGSSILLSIASTVELLVYRFAIDAPRLLTTFGTRLGSAVVLGMLVVVILALEVAASYGGASLGRYLELKTRIETLIALPRVEDHFIRSRPTTDLAYRAHNLVTANQLPGSMLTALRALADLVVTLIAIGWLGLVYLPPLLIGSALLAMTFAITRSRLRELDTRNQVHASRLLTLFLDALRGSRPIRLHGYQDSFRAEQQGELERWKTTSWSLVRTTATLEALNGIVAVALLASVMLVFVSSGSDPRLFVLLAFWAFRIPPTVRALVSFAQSYPLQSVALTRLLEITRYANADEPTGTPSKPTSSGAAIRFQDVTVIANQVPILRNVSLDIAPGEHVAIVGRSGSGKSSLVGLLLGFWKPTAGTLRVDGQPMTRASRGRLLESTIWVDPGVQLWDSTIRDNVDYSIPDATRRPLVETAELSDLLDVIDRMDRGLDTRVGPEGSLISGGEGQRIRLARGLRRADVRLVALDESFRGLDRTTRQRLTHNVRCALPDATLLSVSHDIHSALDFPRVLVLENGQIVEDGNPKELSRNTSRFRDLLDAETDALTRLWGDEAWRRLRVERGGIVDERVSA